MKIRITDISITKKNIDGAPMLECVLTTEDGEHFGSIVPWVNEKGIWASKEDARAPAEMAAWLRNFAASIEKYVQAKAA